MIKLLIENIIYRYQEWKLKPKYAVLDINFFYNSIDDLVNKLK